MLALLATVAAGCSMDELFGTGRGPEAEATTPAGVQKGDVTIVYTLSHASATSADIGVKYSTNGGASFVDATEGEGGSGTTDLSVSPDGVVHTFVWDSAEDVADARLEDVVVRISPKAGRSGETEAFALHNAVFVAASHDAQDGDVSLYRFDLVTGEPRFLSAVGTSGEWPWDVLFHEGIFYVANAGTNDVSALELDEEREALIPLDGSPFSTGGIAPQYLASDGDRVFVANVDSETISILDMDDAGALSLNSRSGVSVKGCRSLVVRVNRLYVASETAAEIVAFDIEDGGELLPNAFSPMVDPGLASPRAMAILGSYLYVANFDVATLSAFRFLGGGELLAVAGSPFTFTEAGAQGIFVHRGESLYLAGGDSASFTAMAVDSTGVATEETGSPVSASGPVYGVIGYGQFIVAGTSTSATLESYLVGEGGELTAADSSPFDANGEIARMAASD